MNKYTINIEAYGDTSKETRYQAAKATLWISHAASFAMIPCTHDDKNGGYEITVREESEQLIDRIKELREEADRLEAQYVKKD